MVKAKQQKGVTLKSHLSYRHFVKKKLNQKKSREILVAEGGPNLLKFPGPKTFFGTLPSVKRLRKARVFNIRQYVYRGFDFRFGNMQDILCFTDGSVLNRFQLPTSCQPSKIFSKRKCLIFFCNSHCYETGTKIYKNNCFVTFVKYTLHISIQGRVVFIFIEN